MRVVSWNVNGIRAIMRKDFPASLAAMAPDVLCLQETKAQDDQVAEALEGIDGYHIYTNSAGKKGYAGTAMLTRKKPITARFDMGIKEHDQEAISTLPYTGHRPWKNRRKTRTFKHVLPQSYRSSKRMSQR